MSLSTNKIWSLVCSRLDFNRWLKVHRLPVWLLCISFQCVTQPWEYYHRYVSWMWSPIRDIGCSNSTISAVEATCVILLRCSQSSIIKYTACCKPTLQQKALAWLPNVPWSTTNIRVRLMQSFLSLMQLGKREVRETLHISWYTVLHLQGVTPSSYVVWQTEYTTLQNDVCGCRFC